MHKKLKQLFQNKYQLLLALFAVIPYLYYPNLNTQHAGIEFYSNNIFFNTWAPISFGSFRYFLFPVDYLIYLLSKAVGSAWAVKLSYSLFIVVAAIGCYYLLKKFTSNKQISLIGSLFYIYGIFGQFVSFWYPQNLLFAMLPIVTLIILNISEKTNVLKISIILSMIFLLLTGVNLTFLAYLGLWIIVLFVYKFLIENKKVFSKTLIIVVSSGIFTFLLSLFYYFTLFSEYIYQKSYVDVALSAETVQWKSSTSWMSELIREMGAVPFYDFYRYYSYPNAQIFIHNLFFILISFVFPFLAICAIALYRKNDKDQKLIAILTTFFLLLFFMAMSVFYTSPTRDIYQWFYDHIPYFPIFRDAYKPMYLIHITYTILISYTLLYLYRYKQKLYSIISKLIIICIFIIAFQFWSGTFLQHDIINIPNYWNQLGQYYKQQLADKVVLLTPNMGFPGYDFTTSPGKNTAFFRSYFDNNVIYEEGGSNFDDKFTKDIYKALSADPICFTKAIGFYGISDVLNQGDLYYQLDPRYITNPQAIEVKLSRMTTLSHVATFTKLSFYAVNGNMVYDSIYAPQEIISGNSSSVCDLSKVIGRKNLTAYIKTSNGNWNKQSVESPKILYTKVSSSLYMINATNIKNTFLLVLNQRFDGGWRLFNVNSNKLSLPEVMLLPLRNTFQQNHILVNLISNGWWVNGNSRTANFVLVYMPQIYFYWGLIISVLTFIGLTITLSLICIKNFKSSKKEVSNHYSQN